ncbi:restriction endonuclease subunit S [Actinoalloteichus sp. AHMU CJ021]|uniref:restriction endonuclease subunit S n=1 Tax=Actinoalloteichus sp. AHMU CJ021 TaxID=2072503 RepID=UPI0026B1C848
MNRVRIKSFVRNVVEKSDGAPRPFIGLEDVESGTGRILVDDLPLKSADDSLFHRPGDVLVNKLRPYLAKSYCPSEPGTATGELLVLRPGPEVDSRFLLYVTLSSSWVEWANATAYGTKMPRTSWELVSEYQAVLPPLEEQRRIADFLDAETVRIDKLLSALTRKLELLLERRRTGVASHIANGDEPERRAATLPWLTTVPAHWEEVRLGIVAQMGSGHTPSRSKTEWWENCTIPWITTGEVSQLRNDRLEELIETREKISEVGLANSAAELHPKGTVFLCRTASAGYSGVMGTDMATSQDFVTWTCGPRLDPYYLLWCLRAMRPDLLGRLATGSTHLTIYVPDLQMMRIPLPSVQEQNEVVGRIRRQNRRIDLMIDRVRRQAELLSERRQALITAAVTGQFDVSAASGRGIEE